MLCLFKFKACRKCNGDLVLDGDEWRCWQCGRYYYPKPALLDMPEEPPDPELFSGNPTEAGEDYRRRARRAPRNLNSLIKAKDLSDRRWWLKNQEVVQYLDRGLSVREVSQLVARGERQVRVVRERLHDMRASRGASLPVGQVAS